MPSKPVEHRCQVCARSFWSRTKDVRFCSRECFFRSNVGDRHWNWKGGERKPADLVCAFCSKPFVRMLRKCDKRTPHCSKSCAAKARWRDNPPKMVAAKHGEDNPAWKGGRYKSGVGYVYVLSRGHHRANSRGYVPEHVLAAEAKIGRPLERGEVVHHLNRVKDDNRPENLVVMSPAEHKREHAGERKRASNGTFN